MSLSKTLVGGLIGALVGLAAHVCLEVFTNVEAPWFGVLIGLLVGLGVRRADDSVAYRASYARGAVAALLTLATILGSTALIPKVVVAMGARTEKPAPAVARGGEADMAPAADGGGAAAVPVEQPVEPLVGRGGQAPVMQRGEFNVLQFASIAIGMFLAYEMARGTMRLGDEEEGAASPDRPGDQPAERPAETPADAHAE